MNPNPDNRAPRSSEPISTARRSNRLKLLAIGAVFGLPVLVATLMSATGWRPSGTKAYGELLNPPRLLASDAVQDENGRSPYAQGKLIWTLLLNPSEPCAEKCRAQLQGVHNGRAMLGRHAPALQVRSTRAWTQGDAVKTLADEFKSVQISSAMAAEFPGSTTDSVSAILIDPQGHLVLRYAAGFDAAGLRRDLGRLVHHNPNSK